MHMCTLYTDARVRMHTNCVAVSSGKPIRATATLQTDTTHENLPDTAVASVKATAAAVQRIVH
jgi:hypothetical protein